MGRRKLTIIVALEHRIYRDAIAAALQEPFPSASIVGEEPAELPRAIAALNPVAVIVDRLEVRQAHNLSWICLDHDYGRRASLHCDGQVVVALEPGLSGLTALLSHVLNSL